jgi:hypothetical protein
MEIIERRAIDTARWCGVEQVGMATDRFIHFSAPVLHACLMTAILKPINDLA